MDITKGTTLTGQDHAIDFSVTEAQVGTEDTHPALYPITTAALDTSLQTGTLGEDISTQIPHAATGATHPNTHHTRATLNTTALIAASLAPGAPPELPVDHTQGRH